MLEKVVYVTSKDETLQKLADKVFPRHFNEAPYGLCEITENEVVTETAFFTYSPQLLEYRQLSTAVLARLGASTVTMKGKLRSVFLSPTSYLAIHCYVMPDSTGVAIARDYAAGRVRWFFFGCDHDYVSKETLEYVGAQAKERGIRFGRCEHAVGCHKCGLFQVIDSSD